MNYFVLQHGFRMILAFDFAEYFQLGMPNLIFALCWTLVRQRRIELFTKSGAVFVDLCMGGQMVARPMIWFMRIRKKK